MNNKIVILILMTVIASGTIIQAFPLIGVWIEQTVVTDKVMNIAAWTTSQLAKHTGLDGDYTFMSVKNIQTQTLSEGINYKFSLDVLIKSVNNNNNTYFLKTCNVLVFDQVYKHMSLLILISSECNDSNPLM